MQRKPRGYWTLERVVEAVQLISDEHGPEAITAQWLSLNQHLGLANAIERVGGYAHVRELVGLPASSRKPRGYWTSDRVTAAARSFAAEHGGAESITQPLLTASGHHTLAQRIYKVGGYAHVRALVAATSDS